MDTIIVTAIGSFAADITIKNMKQIGFRVIGTDIYPKEWIADAYNVAVFYQVPMVTNEKQYLQSIIDICKKESVSHIVPLTDVEVDSLNKNRAMFESLGIVLCISSDKTLRICRNKKILQEFIDMNIPEIHTIPTKYLSENIMPDRYPVIIKPIDGRSSQGLHYIYNQKEFVSLIKQIDLSCYIMQPYISGSIVTVDVVRQRDGKRAVAIPRKELLRTLNGAGKSVQIFSNRQLELNCIKLADSLNIVGCVNFEFVLDDNGCYHFIECNPRFSGGVEFSCIAGYNCIANHIRSFEDHEIDDYINNKSMYIARKYEEYVTHIV